MTNKNKKEATSYDQQLKYIQALWSEIRKIYSTEPRMPSMLHNWDFNKMEKLMDLDGPELYSIKFFYNQLINFTAFGKTVEQPNFLCLVFVVIIAILKERNIRHYLPEREDIIQAFYKKVNLYKKGSNIHIPIYIGDDYQKIIETILPDLIQQDELDKIQQYLTKPNTIYQEEQEKTLNLQNEIDEKLNKQQNKIDELKEMLEKQHRELNFVNLSDAFSKIQKEKKETKNAIRVWLVVFFLLLCIIPICLICTGVEEFRWFKVIPFITLEIICLYVFRLFYQQFLSVKSELLQLDLRVNLCAFIEGYMEFKGKHKDDTVHLFEQLIFSNIISDEKKVPSTVDGLDTLAKLISEIKKVN